MGLGAGRGHAGQGGAARVAAAPKQQAVLGARGEHAVRLCRAAGHQVVDQHANVRLVPPEHKGRLPIPSRERRVEAGDEAKARRLLVARGADDLPRQVEAAARLGVVRQPDKRRPLWPARVRVPVPRVSWGLWPLVEALSGTATPPGRETSLPRASRASPREAGVVCPRTAL